MPNEPKGKHLVDSEVASMLEWMVLPDLDASNLHLLRNIELPPTEWGEDGILVERIATPGQDGNSIPLLIYRPKAAAAPSPTVLYVPGGGFVSGKADYFDWFNRATASELQCAIVGVDYRYGPETAYPGALDDCYAALAWVWENADGMGFDRARLGVMGESAGGGLAAALALYARDRGDNRLAFQVLLEPMLDDRTGSTREPHPYAGQFVWTKTNNRFGWASLLGHEPGGDEVPPYAAPARATDLSNLPATYIAVGSLDLFLEEDMEYARRLIAAGVPTEFHVSPGGFHGFYYSAEAKIAKEFKRSVREALKVFFSKSN